MSEIDLSVLVVDNESAIRQILTRTISSAGCAVDQAVDGADALRKMEESPFDVVITDLQMPNMDGFQLLKEVRSRFPETRVVLITSTGSKSLGEEARKAGADDLIRRPFHNHEIVRKLRRFSQRLSARSRKPKSSTPTAK